MACPADAELENLLRGEASRDCEELLAAHLESCAGCRRRLEDMAGGSGWIGAIPAAIPPADSSAELELTMHLLESGTAGPAVAPEDESLDFLAPAETSGTIGRLGGYDVLERIASGGMGIVLRAHDPSLSRMVAIKVLAPALTRHALSRARFIREARAAAAVAHENVVSIHAVEELQGLPCMIMQLVKGRSLADRLRDSGALRLEEILRIGAQTAHGLAAAHAQGLVHRDIKPGNILLENGIERAKLTDFGLARAVDDTKLTRAGQMAGTPEYMSPEQARGEAVDQRSDLFSLGCVLYEMAAGESPFCSDTTLVVLHRVCEDEPPPLRGLAPALPAWFVEIVARLMRKNPSARFQTASEVAALLEERLRQCRRGEIPVASAPHSRRWMYLALASAIAAAALVFDLTKSGQSPPASSPDKPPSAPALVPVFSLILPDHTRAIFRSLQDAVNAAAPGATIEITAGGRLDTTPVRITGKPLRLRAAPGVLPVLYQSNPAASLLITNAPLVLEGLAFERAPSSVPYPMGRPPVPALSEHADASNVKPESNRGALADPTGPLILVQNAPLRAIHCRFAVRDPASLQPQQSSAAMCLERSDGSVVRDCTVQALHATGFDWESGGALSVSGCVFLGRGFLRVTGAHPAEATRITVERCTIAAQNLLSPHFSSRDNRPLSFTLRHSALDVGSVCLVPPGQHGAEPLNSAWKWIGEGNLYSVRGGRSRYLMSLTESVRSLDEWRAWWPTAESGSVEAQLTFPDLPLHSGSQTEFHAAQLRFTAEGAPESFVAGADVAGTGPGAAYQRARVAGELDDWDADSAKLLDPTR